MVAAERVLGYLTRHRDIGLRYTPDQGDLHGFSDSDWAVRHSTSGWLFMYSSAAVNWGGTKQPTIALSSCEAEIMAASEGAKDGICLTRFVEELGLPNRNATVMGVDNQSAIAIAYNPEHHARTKHIDRRHYFIRECVEHGRLRVPFVATAENVADFFTKPLMGKDFFRMRDRVMNVPRDASSPPSPS